MKKILAKAGDIGLPVAMRRALKTHSEAASDFGEFADRAASLNDETSITEALQAEMERRQALNLPFNDVDQQAMVNDMVGKVGGKTQLDWLTDQLGALFNWRNAMIDAEQKIVQLREKVTEAIEIARKQLERVREQLKENHERKKRLEKRLETLQKHPKRNKEAIKVTKTQIDNLGQTIKTREGVRDNLKDKILPALTGRREMLNTSRGEILSNVEEVQGRGAGMQRWPTLPAMSETGGSIFDTRLKIKELTDKPIRVTAEASTDTGDKPGAEDLKELLRQANLRTAISQAQYKVFKDMPTFATGGIVPGSANAPRVIEAHAGEGVFTRDQMAAMGTGNVVVVIQDGAVDASKIKTLAGAEAERVMRTSSRRASRGLPSAGGGLRG
jgi:gas vesicle protein